MVYLDNAATSLPKPKNVISEVRKCLNYCANAGRSGHKLSLRTSEEIFLTREKLSSFLRINKEENIVFTTNATYALNIAIKTLVPKQSHILISDIEHNSVVRPVEKLSLSDGIKYSVLFLTAFLLMTMKDLWLILE